MARRTKEFFNNYENAKKSKFFLPLTRGQHRWWSYFIVGLVLRSLPLELFERMFSEIEEEGKTVQVAPDEKNKK